MILLFRNCTTQYVTDGPWIPIGLVVSNSTYIQKARERERGKRIYSAAYIMPSGRNAFGFAEKHRNHLRMLEKMMAGSVPRRLQESNSMQNAFELLRSFPMMGNFLAYQYSIDINYSNLVNFDEMEFVMPGPGALSGIAKCFHERGDLTEPDTIRFIADHQFEEFSRLGLTHLERWAVGVSNLSIARIFFASGQVCPCSSP